MIRYEDSEVPGKHNSKLDHQDAFLSPYDTWEYQTISEDINNTWQDLATSNKFIELCYT